MERTKKTQELVYRKTGGGSFWFKGKRIKQNQTFKAFPHEIPDGFKDLIKRVDGESHEAVTEQLNALASKYNLKQRSNTSWYDVVDGNDNVMNENAMRRVDALNLIKELEAEG